MPPFDARRLHEPSTAVPTTAYFFCQMPLHSMPGAHAARPAAYPSSDDTSFLVRHPGRWSAILLLCILLTGCRTYGGSESEEAIYSQMERMLERFEDELARSQADLRMLESAALQDPVVEALSAYYADLVSMHQARLARHRQLVQELSPGSDYRTLHRAYGAMIAEQSLQRQRYAGMLRFVYDAYSTDTTDLAEEGRRPYASVPPYYVRMAHAGRDLSVREVLSRIQSGAAPRPDFTLVLPETRPEMGGSGEAVSH